MLVDIPQDVVAAMQSSTNTKITTFIMAEVAKYNPKGIITDAMIPADTTGITFLIKRVAAAPLTMQVTFTLTGVSDNIVKTNAEAVVLTVLNAKLSPLRVWSSVGMSPDEVVDMFDATLLARILSDNITMTFNTQVIDPEIPFGSV